MSSRNMRRLMREREDEKEKENKEETKLEDFQPNFVQVNNPAFEGLEVSSDESSAAADSEAPGPSASTRSDSLSSLSDGYQDQAAALPDQDQCDAKNKTAKGKNKKKKTKKKSKPTNMDEVDWSVSEVNRILGKPAEEKTVAKVVDEQLLLERRIFAINADHINVNFELARAFGDEKGRARTRLKGTRRMRHEIGLSPDVIPFQLKGLSMACYKTEGDVKYFKFEHSADYQTRCRSLVNDIKRSLFTSMRQDHNLHSENCVESLIENCDFLYKLEEHTSANKALEQAIYCMQSVGAPSFNFVDGKTRLPYHFVENRPFHVALLKYLHILTNIACHRTALELAKVLINLDPSDPLAVIFIIDTVAIRAREYQWLIDLIEFWKDERQADRLFHMRYSLALAMFQLACKHKNHNEVESATVALTTAIKEFPPVAAKLMEFAKASVPNGLKTHELFVPPANVPESKKLNELMTIYAWLNVPRWRESTVWRWFVDTLVDVTDAYDLDPKVKEDVVLLARLRGYYRRVPTQIKRHMHVLKPMAKYIFDNIPEGPMPTAVATIACNPYPTDGPSEDTYHYFTPKGVDTSQTDNAFLAFIQNIYPEMGQLG